jgi:hypothetical protein
LTQHAQNESIIKTNLSRSILANEEPRVWDGWDVQLRAATQHPLRRPSPLRRAPVAPAHAAPLHLRPPNLLSHHRSLRKRVGRGGGKGRWGRGGEEGGAEGDPRGRRQRDEPDSCQHVFEKSRVSFFFLFFSFLFPFESPLSPTLPTLKI